jgi:hypothetical protein
VEILGQQETPTSWRDLWWHPAGEEIWSLDEQGDCAIWSLRDRDKAVAHWSLGETAAQLLPAIGAGHFDIRTIDGALRSLPIPAVASACQLPFRIGLDEQVRLVFSPAEGRLLALRLGEEVHLYDGITLSLLAQQTISFRGLLAFDPGTQALVATEKKGLLRWPPLSGASHGFGPPKILSESSAAASTLTFSPNGEDLLVAIGNRISLRHPPNQAVESFPIEFTPDQLSMDHSGVFLAACSAHEQRIALWQRRAGRFQPLTLPLKEASSAVFVNEAGHLATLGVRELSVWRLSEGTRKFSLSYRSADRPLQLAVSTDAPLAAIAGGKDGVVLIDVAAGSVLAELRHPVAGKAVAAALSSHGDRVAVATENGWLVLWSISRLTNEWRRLRLAGTAPTVPAIAPISPVRLAFPASR